MYKEDELISAFHKSLRDSNIPMACYWSKMIINQIGIWKVKQYMLLVCFEETLNITLYKNLIRILKKDICEDELYKLIAAFVSSKKKWEYKEGQNFIINHWKINNEINEDLVKNEKRYEIKEEEYIENFFNIQQWGYILETSNCYNKKEKTFKLLQLGYTPQEFFFLFEKSIRDKDLDKVIYFSIYLFKNKDLFSFDIIKLLLTKKESIDLYETMAIFNGKFTYVYNYIFLFLLEICHFPFDVIYEKLYEENDKKINRIKDRLKFVEDNKKYLDIPLKAIDRHTHKGKELLKNKEINYGKKIDGLDLRLSGSWFAIIWRIFAIKQYGTIDVNWEDVSVPDEYNLF